MILATEPRTKPQMAGMGQAVFAREEGHLGALLGSCIGVAIYHRRMKLAALAHVVLSDSAGQMTNPAKFANTAIPHLVDLLVREGANCGSLAAKIAGGASMFGAQGPMQIGDKNLAAVIEALRTASIPLMGQNVGGTKGPRMVFDVANGEVVVEIAGQESISL